MAESFGADPERYDRLRPPYPAAMVDAIVAGAPGPDVLDVGCGTGNSSRLFQRAGCSVLGIDPDPRMAEFAVSRGVDVEAARFEAWDRAGRTFDAVVSGTSWHWVEPRKGALLASEALRPGGVFAAFWNVHHLPGELAAAFNEIYARIARSSLFAKHGGDAHSRVLNRSRRGLDDSGAFDKPRVRRFEWEQTYTRDEWLDLTGTFGGHGDLEPDTRDGLFADLGAAIDAVGDDIVVHYETLLLTAVFVEDTEFARLR